MSHLTLDQVKMSSVSTRFIALDNITFPIFIKRPFIRLSRWLPIYQAKFVALGVGHHAPAEAVLPEILHRQSPTTQGLNLGRRLLDVVDSDVEVEAIFEGFRLRNALEVDVWVVRARLRKTDIMGRFAKGTVDL
jgi:hypothetical protein